MEYTLSHQGTDCTIQFTGEIGIINAGDIKTEFLNALSDYKSVTVDIEEVQDIDMTIIQLLCSANQSFEKKDKLFKILNGDNQAVKSSIAELGYDSEDCCPENLCRNCLWKGGK